MKMAFCKFSSNKMTKFSMIELNLTYPIHLMALPSVSLHSFFEDAAYHPSCKFLDIFFFCWNVVSIPPFHVLISSPLSKFKPNNNFSVLSFCGCTLVRFSSETEPKGYVYIERHLF